MASRVIQENTRHTARRATNTRKKTTLVLPKTRRRRALRREVAVGGVAINILLQENVLRVSWDLELMVNWAQVAELRVGSCEADNGGVRLRMRWAILAVAALALCVAGVQQSSAKVPAAPPAEMRVDINHASIEELLKIPGMKRTWAERIVRSRPYRAKNELLDRGVVPSQIYDRIKDYVIAHREKH